MKTQMKNRNQFLFAIIVVVFVIAALFILFAAHIISVRRSLVETPVWLPFARIVTYLFAVYCFASSFLMKQYIRRKSTDKIVKHTIDPDLSILIIGLARFLTLTCIAFFIFFFSGLLTDLYICSALSVIGIIFWPWYQRAKFKID